MFSFSHLLTILPSHLLIFLLIPLLNLFAFLSHLPIFTTSHLLLFRIPPSVLSPHHSVLSFPNSAFPLPTSKIPLFSPFWGVFFVIKYL